MNEVPDYQKLLTPVQLARLRGLATEFGGRRITAEDIPEGHSNTWERTINQDAVYAFADGVEDFSTWYIPGLSPFGKPIVPPLMLSRWCDRTLESIGVMAAWIHTENRSHIVRPVEVGSTIRFEGRVANKFTKRGRRYVTLALQLYDTENDDLVFEEERTFAESFVAKAEVDDEG